jgi:hypothetical protein
MTLTPKQLEEILQRVVVERIESRMATKEQLDELTASVENLAHKVQSYLDEEWHVHLHDAHARLDARLERVEKKLGLENA